ncbi:autotransporter-associated N-terminal domain-containing protein [Fusobacterium nucleatum]|uniref:Outer membrane autotransporter barrel domain protein n=2 Tax=Fusobacterium nucleatum TaxID=851 RepID=A0A133PE80_FUSNU|nr:autotransporter-associated N-terminal domain-containing protein [Fusobacterium nucleatum]KXA26859.1 outer membrane autotransporter barrel domain protein [Fusobacterium nucleatum]
MKDYKKVENCLKSFLKNNKRLSYSVALLVTFLINGGFSYADEAVQAPLRTELKVKIEKEQENISQMLKETEESMKDIDLKIKKLTQRGQFWVKPLEKSNQVFFFANWGNYSKNKNKTESNFNGPEYSASYGSSMGYGQFSNGKYYGEYGIVKNPLEFVDKIDFGANITPKAVAEKSIVEKTVVKKDITAPIVSSPTVEVGEITLTAPKEVAIGEMETPNEPNPSVTTPSTVPTLQGIRVAAVSAVNVTPSTPEVAAAPKINAPTVQPPATPAGFTPRLITPPEEPVVTLPKIKIPAEISYPGFGSTLQVYYDYWGGGNDSTMIDQMSITAGKFKATSGSGAYIQGYQGESGYSATKSTLVKETPTGTIPATNQFHSLSRNYFFGIRNSAFMQWASGVEISWFGQGGSQLIYMETSNYSEQNLDKLNAGGVLGADLYNEIDSYKTLSGLKDNGDGANGINLHNNKGNIYLGNSDTRYQATTTISRTRLSVFNNEGTITGLNLTGEENGTDGKDGSKKQVVYFNTPDTTNDQRWIYGNGKNGKINLYGSEAIAMYFTGSGESNLQQYVRTAFVNDGEINLYGINSSGVVVNRNQKLRPESGIYLKKPVHLYADGARGLYIPGDISNLPAKNVVVRVKIGEKGNDTAGFNWTDIQTGKTKNIKSNGNFEGAEYSTDYVDNAIGVMYTNISANAKMQVPDITLEKHSKKGIGILALNGKLTVTDGNISIKGGIGNTALVAKEESSALSGGEIDYIGDINIGKSGIDNDGEAKEAMVAYAEGKNIKITGKVDVDSVDSVSIYSKKGKVTVEGDVLIKSKGKNVVAMYTDNGTINIKRTTLSGKTDIDITGDMDKGKATGVALYAKDGGKINAQKLSLKVTNGSAGIVSVGKNTASSSSLESNIDFSGGKLEYTGNGYAVYSDGTGTVNLSNAELNLSGSSTAFDVDLGAATLPTKLNSGTKIKVHSDNVIAFNLKNASGLTTVGGIETSIKSKIETKLGLGSGSLNNLFTGSTSNKYKVAAVDGGEITVGDLDKSGTAADTAGAKKDGYEYFNRFLAQRLKATASGKTIKAVLTTEDATERFNGQVVGFEMNSSKNATSVDETAINLVNSKIIADRTDAGTGAIGAFINYGEVNIDATSKIEVEKENNVVNTQAVGVYAVNGSKVDNKGTIDVGGDQSVGILGMAYRENASHNPIVKEFGDKATNQGLVNITNEKDIKMSGKDAIGIYAMNNNTDNTVISHLVTNKGTVEVGDSAEKTAVGIYTKGVSVNPKGGKIKIGKKAVGIYAENSNVGKIGKDLGTIDFNGDNGVGIYLKGGLSNLDGNKVTLSESGTSKNKVGILADRGTSSIIKTEVAVGALNNVIAYYSKGDNELNVQSNLTLNENSIGMSGEADLKYGHGANSYTMKLGKGSTGVLGKKKISLEAGTNIELNGENSVGAYASGANGIISSNGNIKFTKENSIGLYGADGATIKDKTSMDFSNVNAKNNIGIYLAGAKWVDSRTTAYTFNSDHSKNNIYLFAQGGSTATLKNIFNVNPSTAPSGNNRTIGMYLDTAVKGGATTADNTVDTSDGNAKISVTNGAIGIYAKNADNSKNNIINTLKVLSDGQGTVGVFTDGNLKLNGTGGIIEAKNAGIGLYGNKGTVTVEGTHKVEVTNAGTGMYLTKGSHLSGGKLELENKTAGTSAAGIYYEGTGNEVDHNTDIEVTAGENLLALYANGLKLNNNKEILIKKGKNNVAAYITGNSTFRNKGKIQLGHPTQNDFESGIGVYVVDGEAINESGKTIDIYDFENTASGGSLSVGMLANAAGGKTAKIINAGTINANGEAIGMVVENDSEGLNDTGAEIVAKNEEPLKAIGAYINGANAKFTNSGTISADNIGLALKDTTANKILNSGTLKLTKTGAVGVYANNSIVDFNIAPTVASTVASTVDKTVALYASGTTKIKSQITSASGVAHIGVYAEDNAEFLSGSKVTVGNGDGKDYGIGVYTKSGYNKTVNTDIKLTGEKTIGFYLGATGGSGSTVTHTGTIDVGSGIGAYIPEHSKFVAQNTTFNVGDKGTAVYLKGGEVDLGKTGTANINFNGTNGRAIYQDGGTITTGTGLHITGSGSFLTLKNANSSINSLVEVGANGIGINGIYDSNAQDYTLKLDSPTGHIKLSGNKATGIAAVAENKVASKKVDIINKGTIETISGEKTTGIYGKGANIENATGAKINIGAKGVGIYTTNDSSLENTTLNNAGEINLEGDEAVGIVAIKAKTNQDFVVGKITGTKNKLVGAYFKGSLVDTKVKDFDISLGDNAKGLVFDGGSDFTVTSSSTNKVKIGDTTGSSRGIGIAALGVNGTVSNTDVVVGKNSLGLYVKDKKLTFDLASGKLESSDANRSSILAYADGNNSEVALNGGGTLKVGANGIALGTKGGKITANAATTVEVDGVKGLGAYVENGGSIDSKFDIKVKSAEGIGMYAKGGALASVAKVSELKGNKSIGYVFENVTNAINMPNSVQLTDTNATGQVGVAVKGTGAGLTVAGVSVVGSKNIGIYNETTGAVTNNGALNVGDSTGDSSIGIYSQGGTVTSTGNATIGKNSVGIYGKDAGAKLSGVMTVDEKGIGLYVDNDTNKPTVNTEITSKLEVGNNGTIGIQATNSNIKLGGDLTVGDNDSKGIFSKGAGDIETAGNITVGKDSVGIYKEGTGKVETAAGKTLTVAEKGYGIYSKDAEVDNKMNLTVNEDAIGVYVENNNLTSNGNVVVGDKGVGLLVKGAGKTLTSTGNITVGSNNSVGLYAGDDANIVQSGNVTVADNNGIGVYSKGSGHITTYGNITVGKDSIGVYKDGKGTMNIGLALQTMTIGDKGYGIYYKGNSVADSIINSNMNMTLGKEAVGIYGKNATINHIGNITVGETTIGSDGFENPKSNKNSIGIFGDNSNINFKGNMLVDKPLSVGIYGANGGSITVKSGSTITVKNGATGIMTGSKFENITLESGSTLNVDGKVDSNVYTNATKSNVSFGIAAYSGLIDNQGTINVTNGATGIYLAGTASLKNGATGTINIDATSKSTAKLTKASAELGGIKVTDKGEVTINNKVINGGTLNVKGALNMEGLGLDISTGKTVVDAKSISGVAEVLPSFSKGNSEQKVTIKDVFRTGVVGAFSGDVKSKSVSWIAKISKAPGSSTTTSDITMVRIPYNSLISGERYKNLASGLEDIRSKIGKDSSSPIFKSLDNISSHRDFARAAANIRGDVYSNIQERMKTVENSFDKSYNELLSSYNKTRNVDKFSVIYTGGEHKDSTLGVSGYEYKSTGVLYLNDREAFTYGGKYGWSAGIVGSNFEFKGDTNKGSKERVISGKLGLHYQAPLNKDDDNARLRWLTRGEITVNNHRTKRYSQVGADTYQNKASFYSTELSWKNIISYDYDISTNWTVKPYTGIDISYGHIFNIKEKNEGLPLEVKGKDYFVITPNVGVETKYVLPLGAVHQAFAKVDTEFSYDVTKLYHGVNQAKMKNASTGYYDLSKPERRRARVAVGAELGLEKENAYGITFRAEYQGYKKSQLNYGVRLNYKF